MTKLYNMANIETHLTDGCNALSDCDANAQCLFSNREQRFQCECNQNFFGDGKSCYRSEQSIRLRR